MTAAVYGSSRVHWNRGRLFPSYSSVALLRTVIPKGTRWKRHLPVALLLTSLLVLAFASSRPHRAYFGKKDAQQVAVIRQLVQDLAFPLRLVECPMEAVVCRACPGKPAGTRPCDAAGVADDAELMRALLEPWQRSAVFVPHRAAGIHHIGHVPVTLGRVGSQDRFGELAESVIDQ